MDVDNLFNLTVSHDFGSWVLKGDKVLKPKKVSFEDAQLDVDVLIAPKEETKEVPAETPKKEEPIKWSKKEIFDDVFEYSNGTYTFLVHRDGKELSTSVVTPDGKNIRIIKNTWKDLTATLVKSDGKPREEPKVEEIDEIKLVDEVNTELSFLNELLEDAKEDKNKELISELEDRIEFLEELRDDALPYEKGGSLKGFKKIIVNFNTDYTPARLYFKGYSKNNATQSIGWATSELYLPSVNVLNLQEIKLNSEYDNPEDMKRIIAAIKRDLEKKTGKTTLMIKNSIQ
jgi:DNA-dependent RNA polymerase auxiliary subunit epsilon